MTWRSWEWPTNDWNSWIPIPWEGAHPWRTGPRGGMYWHFICILKNKACLRIKKVKQPHWPALQTRQKWYTPLIPIVTQACHRNQVVVVHAPNPRTREDYKMGGDSSQSQSHYWDSWSNITISDWGRGKSQWLVVFAFLTFRLNPNFCLWIFINPCFREIPQRPRIEPNINGKKKSMKWLLMILCYHRVMPSPAVIREASPSNWWKQMQRPTVKHWVKLRESCWREWGRIDCRIQWCQVHKKTYRNN